LLLRRILIANRGEIAVRIARSCRELGISAVAVYSDADRAATHTRAADEAVAIGPSYLDIEPILEAAQRVGADAIHPGYGFLAENAEFADACGQAGIVFIGPSPATIRKMGLKTAARDVAAAAGVPVVPAYRHSDAMEYPVLVKASAGGGGRGMRIVREAGELDAALESAAREAERSFGNGELLIEKFVEGARHVEFQIFGDEHGNLIHLFERDCSLQRRHQKMIEESPSPALNEDLRRRMGTAAVAVGKAIGYLNAGTVEFLVTPSGEFYFIEVNTRIQVEHPVTEMITGLDLVKLQIDVAEGKPLPASVAMHGHAIEARLNAEDPANDFLPTAGTVAMWRPPRHARVDTALEEGQTIGIHYDSLLAKIIVHAPDREQAIRKLVQALKSMCVLGIGTNREYLIQLLDSEEFRGGRAHTGFLPSPKPALVADPRHFGAAAILYREHQHRRLFPGVPPGYRNNPYRNPTAKLEINGKGVAVNWKRVGGNCYEVDGGAAEAIAIEPGQIQIAFDGLMRTYEVREVDDAVCLSSPIDSCVVRWLPRHPRPVSASTRETANSPMPGQVLRILVREGQQVNAGDPLVVLEAMKMEQTIRTTINGMVIAVLVEPGQVVAPGQMLVQIGALEDPQ
jgi:propionyl-CoA carboxylase alpha chain